MPNVHVIDQEQTFVTVAFMGCEPRRQFGTDTQDTTKDGIPKWDVQLAVAVPPNGNGRQTAEMLRVGIAAHADPAKGIPPLTPVQLEGFRAGVMIPKPAELREGKTPTIYYQATAVRPANGASRKAEG